MKRKMLSVFLCIAMMLIMLPLSLSANASAATAKKKSKLGFNMCVFPRWATNYTTDGKNTAADRLEEAEDVLAEGYVNQTFLAVDENFEKMMALCEKYDCQFWIGGSTFHSDRQTIENYVANVEEKIDRIIAAGQWDNFLGFWWDEPVWAHGQSNEDLYTMTKALYEKWGKRNYVVFAVGAFIDDYDADCDTIAASYTTYITDAGWDNYAHDVGDEAVAAQRANPDEYKSTNEKYGTNIKDAREYYRWTQSEFLEKFTNDVKVWFYPCTYKRTSNTTEKYCLDHMNFFNQLLMEQENPGGLTLYTYPTWSTVGLEELLPVKNLKTGKQKLFPDVEKWETFAKRQKELCQLYNVIEIEENPKIPFGHLNVTEVTENSITIQAEEGYSYSISGGEYKEVSEFKDLKPLTRYTISVRRDSDKQTKSFKVTTKAEKPYASGYNDNASYAMRIPKFISNYSSTFGYISTSLSRNESDTGPYLNDKDKASSNGFMPIKSFGDERFIKIATAGGDGNAVIDFSFGDEYKSTSDVGISEGVDTEKLTAFAIRVKITGGSADQLSIFDFYISSIKGQKRTDNAKNYPIRYYDIKTKEVSTLTYKYGINVTGNIDGWIIVPFDSYNDLDGDKATTNLESIKEKLEGFQIWMHEGSGCKHGGKSSSWTGKAWYIGDILYIEDETSFVKGRNQGFVGLPAVKDAPVAEKTDNSSKVEDDSSEKTETQSKTESESNRRPSLSVSSKTESVIDSESQISDNDSSDIVSSDIVSSNIASSEIISSSQIEGEQNSDDNYYGTQDNGDQIVYEYYIPTYVWYIVAAGVVLAVAGAVVLIVVLKKKKAKTAAAEPVAKTEKQDELTEASK